MSVTGEVGPSAYSGELSLWGGGLGRDRAFGRSAGESIVEVDGEPYQRQELIINVGDFDGGEDWPTKLRLVVEIAPNLDEDADIVIPILPGWGETSMQFEGDFSQILFKVLKKQGYKNPKIVGVNTSGRGTGVYDRNSAKAFNVGLQGEIDDAARIAEILLRDGHLGKNMALIGHSMGVLNSMSFLKTINENRGDVNARVSRVMHFMPATDEPFAFMNPLFLWAVRNQVLPALGHLVSGSGALKLAKQDYDRMMLSGAEDEELLAGSSPDSAKRFLQLIFNTHRRFEDVFAAGGAAEDVDFTVFRAQNDELIPSIVSEKWAAHLASKPLVGDVKERVLQKFPHVPPYDMNAYQKQVMHAAFEGVFVK